MKFILPLLLLTSLSCKAGQSFSSIENSIFRGEFTEANIKINQSLKTAKGNDKSLLYQLKGDILKLEGDLDEALKYWKKSNQLRREIFPKGNYHLAWNYALLSNYYYEKMEPKLAVAYADSCKRLIRGLNNNQQKEIKIFKIWNILGQSYKLGLAGIDRNVKLKKYEVVRSYYLKSLRLIRKEKFSIYYEAKTLHLLGNSYVDNVYDYLHEQNNFKKIKLLKTKAETSYHKADEAWRISSENYYHERAKTLYVHALLLSILPKETFPNSLDQSIRLFEESELVFGMNNDLSKIPNKQDALQCLWLHKGALYEKIRRTNRRSGISELERLNKISINLWQIVYKSFRTKNLNQILSIYGLVPYQDVITIENLKRKFNEQWSKEKIFQANQMLKYYDLNRFTQNNSESRLITLKEVQKKLKKNECFIDFISDHLFLFITKGKTHFIELDLQFHRKLDSLNTAITQQDYQSFCSTSRGVYNDLFPESILKGITSIHISPAQRFNVLPFETLLQSDQGITSKQYSKLDYLIRSKEISYYLSASYLFRKPKKLDFTGTSLAPRSWTSSKLPFSENLAIELNKDYPFHWVESNSTNKQQLMSARGNIIHFSGHGIIDPQNPSLSKLDFGSDFLTLEEVYQFKKTSPFVVLNACNSQNGKTNVGDGVNGFARAFHALGAQASLSNIWEVDDQASNELLRRFYERVSEGAGIIPSFRQAQLSFIEESNGFEAPYYWAGHRLFGDIEIEENKKTPKSIFMWILGALGLVGLFFRFFKRIKSVKN